jgi:glycosyltransferase involved in cell wall biosynthesis
MKILCIHQGFELYGSDRTFLQSVQAFRQGFPEAAITVLLPRKGLLYDRMREIVQDVRTVDLMVLRKSELNARCLLRMPSAIARIISARRAIEAHDVTYINSVVVLDYILGAAFASRKSIVHVHEIPSAVAARVFSLLLRVSRAHLIFNSQAASSGIGLPPSVSQTIVLNGVASQAGVTPPAARPSDRPLRLLLLGRFNSWKGQTLLVEAISQLSAEERGSVEVRLVGSVFEGQTQFEAAIRTAIAQAGLEQIVRIDPFQPDPLPLYAWADVIVVPSTKPEPFGLVAVESMRSARPVIAAAHGGLLEIVRDGETGTLFAPRSADALAAAIRNYLRNSRLAMTHGAAALQRFNQCFREDRYMDAIAREMKRVADRNSGSPECS